MRNLWAPPGLDGFKTFALITGISQGLVNPVVKPVADITGCKILDLIAIPGTTVTAGTPVTFLPSNPNWLTDEGLRGRTWRWTFGSGPNQVTPDPTATNVYSVPGLYTVTLRGSTDEQGDIDIVKTDFITVNP
jgi:PKD repeat protein